MATTPKLFQSLVGRLKTGKRKKEGELGDGVSIPRR